MTYLNSILEGYDYSIKETRGSITVTVKAEGPRSIARDSICARLTDENINYNWNMQSPLSSMGHAEFAESNLLAA